MGEEWTEAPQWEPEEPDEAFLNLFPSSEMFSSYFDIPLRSSWQDLALFLDPQMNQYDTSYGSFENTPAVEDSILDMLSSEGINSPLFQNATPGHNVSDRTADQPSTPSLTLSVEKGHSPTASSQNIGFQACLHEFDGGPKNVSPPRKRNRFSAERRKEVSQLRKVGACIRCRLTKSSCKLDHPCTACVKICGDPKLGKALCVRQSLLNVRFAHDLWNRSSDLHWLKSEVTPLKGEPWTIKVFLYHPFRSDREALSRNLGAQEEVPYISTATPLEIRVQSFTPLPGREALHEFHGHNARQPILTKFYAIPEDSLPTLRAIEDWALDTMVTYPRHAFLGWLRSTFVHFARSYYESDKELPLKGLMQKAVRLSALHGVLCRILQLPRESDSQPKQYVSRAVQNQVILVVTKGIIDLEVEVLSALQKIVFGSKGPGKGNMLPVWTALWLMILTYRDTPDYVSSSEQRYEKLSRHMYDMLVSIYSGLFRPSSPLRLNWIAGSSGNMFGGDDILLQRLGTLKTEFSLFDKAGGHHHSKDILLRTLIFECEMRGIRKAYEPVAYRYYESSKKYFP